MRANGSAICTRTIHIDCKADQLNSAFCYILRRASSVRDGTKRIRVKCTCGWGASRIRRNTTCAPTSLASSSTETTNSPSRSCARAKSPPNSGMPWAARRTTPKEADFMHYTPFVPLHQREGLLLSLREDYRLLPGERRSHNCAIHITHRRFRTILTTMILCYWITASTSSSGLDHARAKWKSNSLTKPYR